MTLFDTMVVKYLASNQIKFRMHHICQLVFLDRGSRSGFEALPWCDALRFKAKNVLKSHHSVIAWAFTRRPWTDLPDFCEVPATKVIESACGIYL